MTVDDDVFSMGRLAAFGLRVAIDKPSDKVHRGLPTIGIYAV